MENHVTGFKAVGFIAVVTVFSCSSDPPKPDDGCTPSGYASYPGSATGASWENTKAMQTPVNNMPAIFEPPSRQKLSTLAWEDGIYISRDGLGLYAFYAPLDFFKIVSNGANPSQFPNYTRGPKIGQDFSNPLGQNYEWIHADVAFAQRTSVDTDFCEWKLSNLRDQFYNLGAPQGVLSADGRMFDLLVYTTDNTGGTGTKIAMAKNLGRELGTSGVLLPPIVNEPAFSQDNPHAERFDSSNPNNLVLFFDSPNKPGLGAHDIWFTLSSDGGSTWSVPANVNSINTDQEDIQPHLYFDGSKWWIYYAATNRADSKLAIFRAQQRTANDWNSWQNKELVVSAGSTGSVGEPTLTGNGDLSFVVIYHNSAGATNTDAYDADPWFMKKK